MFRKLLPLICGKCRRLPLALTNRRSVHVSVIGGTTPVGQSVSMLLTATPGIKRLDIYDDSNATLGVAKDLSHIPSTTLVSGWLNSDSALRFADIVVLAQGLPRKSNHTDKDLLRANAESLVNASKAIATCCPDAFVVVCTEPINITVPLVGRVLEHNNVEYEKKLFGVTAVDLMRAQKYFSLLYDVPSEDVYVPVIGGHSPKTIVPLFSHATPQVEIATNVALKLTELVRGVEKNINKIRCNWGDSPLTSALACYSTIDALIKSMDGDEQEHYAFVSNDIFNTKYLASLVVTDKDGIKILKEHNPISKVESKYLSQSLEQLVKDVIDGEASYDEYLEREYSAYHEESTKRNYFDTNIYSDTD